MQQRRDEILAKKAKLAELKRQRELRQNTSISGSRLSYGSNEVRNAHSPSRIGLFVVVVVNNQAADFTDPRPS